MNWLIIRRVIYIGAALWLSVLSQFISGFDLDKLTIAVLIVAIAVNEATIAVGNRIMDRQDEVIADLIDPTRPVD